MMRSTNYEKYFTKNPFVIFFVSKFSKNIVSVIKKYRIKQILDAGCGGGFIIKAIRKKIPPLIINGMDIDQRLLDIAKSSNPGIKFSKGNIEDIPYKRKSFEAVMALEVLEHLKSPEKALDEICNTSKKFCIISVPYEPYFSLANLLRLKNISRLGKDPEHIHFWRKKQIKRLLSKKMKILEIKTSFPWLIFVCSVDI